MSGSTITPWVVGNWKMNPMRANANQLIEEFKQLFEESTKVLNYVIEYNNNEFILHGLITDTEAITSFVQASNATVFVKYHATLDTNGGIKNIS